MEALIVLAGMLTMAVAIRAYSLSSKQPVPEPKKGQWDVDVEVLFVPPSGDWEAAIQKQLDAIEDRSPDNELVSATSVNGRLVLFYKRRKA